MKEAQPTLTARRFGLVFRVLFPCGLVFLCAWYLRDDWSRLDGQVILAALYEISALQWLGSLAAVTIAFTAVAGQERTVMAHLGLAVEPGRGRSAAMATAAVSQTLGFGPLVGTIVRKRLLPELSLSQSAQVSVMITVGFFGGIGLLWLCLAAAQISLLLVPTLLCLIACLVQAASSRLPKGLSRRLPDGWTTLKFLLWLMIDLTALGVAAWLVLPSALHADVPLYEFLPMFLTALGAGIASGTPAGTGPFEVILLDGIGANDQNGLAAGIIAFRLSGYAIPAVIGAAFATLAPRWRSFSQPGTEGRPRILTPVSLGPAALRKLRRAEIQLALQGELALLRAPDDGLWLHGRVPGFDVFVGDPATIGETGPCFRAALDAAISTAAHNGRFPCLYRVGPRLAAVARSKGMTTQIIAREAILDPSRFSTAGSARSGLRRKLRHAEQAGVTVSQAEYLPLTEMADVADDWACTHGGERGFSMGRFNPSTLAHQAVFLAWGEQGQLLAFISFHRSAGEWVLDLIRCRKHVPDGTLYLLTVSALEAARQSGITRLSLASVPEPGWGMTGPFGRIARRLTTPAQGLAQFKQAFRPHWEKRYIVAQSRLHLLIAAGGVALAIHRRSPRTSNAAASQNIERLSAANSHPDAVEDFPEETAQPLRT